MSFFAQTELNKITQIALEAGDIALQYHKSRNFSVSRKLDNSEVTDADLAVSKFINFELNREFPGIISVCEENKNRDFLDEIFWLIDPIDGTSSFIKGSDEFAINIALIKNKKPIFGLIYAPAFEGGKLVTNDENGNILINNKPRLSPRILASDSRLKIITSKRTSQENLENFIAQFYPQFTSQTQVTRMSSATKFIVLLENNADIYLACRETMEWDIAAGHALVQLAGGKLKNLVIENQQYKIAGDMSYKKPDFANQFFISYL